MGKTESSNQTNELGYNKDISLEYTLGQDKFFNIEKIEDGATIEMIERIKELSDIERIEVVADIGCGSNAGHLDLWMKASQAKRIIGVEPSIHMIDLLRERIEVQYENTINIIRGDWINTNLESDSVDLAVSRFSLHHIENIEDGYKELSRILISGGYAVISLPHPEYCRKELESKGRQVVEGASMEVDVFGVKINYFYHELETYLGAALARNGLMLIDSNSLNWGTKDVTDIINTLVFTLKKI